MKRFLTTGFLGAILGIVIGGAPADASLISRGFLDEVLTSYATTTALDLKANQSDFTDLNTEISGSVDVLRQLLEQGGYSYELVNNINPEKFPNTISGAFTLLHQYLEFFAGSILHGWTDSKNKTYLGVKGLNDKIGDLPTEIVIGNSNGPIDMFNITKLQRVSLPKDYTLSDFIQDMYYGSFGSNVGLGSSPFYGLSDIINHVMYGGIIGEASPDLTGKQYKGLIDLTREINKIGDLPTYIPTINMANYEVEPIEVSELKVKDYFDIIRALLDGSGLESADASKVIPPYVYIAQQAVKIGTVPDGYETVGAALTAMDAKIDARELPSSSADGQYVLSAKKVGDTITYTWVKMDLTSEEQAQ